MTPEQFAYWLQGFAELNDKAPTQEQWDSIRAHIALVFKKETPPVQFKLKKEEIDPLQEAMRRFNDQQSQEKFRRYTSPPVSPIFPYWSPQITC